VQHQPADLGRNLEKSRPLPQRYPTIARIRPTSQLVSTEELEITHRRNVARLGELVRQKTRELPIVIDQHAFVVMRGPR
jgi:hypothetical protein